MELRHLRWNMSPKNVSLLSPLQIIQSIRHGFQTCLHPLNLSPHIIEEHDSITSLIAAVESGRGVAVIAQPLNGLASPRLKIRPLQPAPPPLAVGIAYRKKSRSKSTDNFIEAARRAKGG
jgi:DNA-binding transcriptional LysR family regulator